MYPVCPLLSSHLITCRSWCSFSCKLEERFTVCRIKIREIQRFCHICKKFVTICDHRDHHQDQLAHLPFLRSFHKFFIDQVMNDAPSKRLGIFTFQDFVPVNKTKEQKMHICLAIFSTFFLIITIVFTFDCNFVVLKNITVNVIPWRFKPGLT